MSDEFEMTERRPHKSASRKANDDEYSYGSRDRAVLANLGKKQSLKVRILEWNAAREDNG